MKKTRIITIICIALLPFALSGCDAFRRIAGRPTSKDIIAKKVQIELEEYAHRRRMDSLKTAQQQITDSLAVLDSIRNSKSSLVEGRLLSDAARASLSHRYYIVIGAFSSADNAKKLADRVVQAGFEASLIEYRNGFTAVGVCPADRLQTVYESLKRIRGEKFCPADAWILDNKQ